MTPLKTKIQSALEESRILLIGAQVLVGFGYRVAFEKRFEELPATARYLELVGLATLLVGLGLLVGAASHHRIVDRGEDTPAGYDVVNRMLRWALLPFAVGIGTHLYVATSTVASPAAATVAAAVGWTLALFFWYGLELLQRKKRREGREMAREGKQEEKSGIDDKVRHVLTEARMVLPGAQALLGFQFATMLSEGFQKISAVDQWLHFGALVAIAVSVVLLMAPPSWHRIVCAGENTDQFHRVASRFMVAAMVPMALGVAVDLYVVAHKISASRGVAALVGGGVLALFVSLWFVVPLVRREREAREERHPVAGGPEPATG